MLPFMVMAVAGAFIAWRHNPMYTFGKTVRFLLVVGLTLAGVVGALLTAINLTTGKSQAVQMTAIFAVTGLGTLAMIGVVIELSLPKAAALPKTVKLLRFHRGKVDVWAKRVGWGMLAAAVVALILPPTGRLVVGGLGGFFAFLAIVMLFAGYLSARKMDEWLTEVELRPWVHWTYTTEQWGAWNALRVRGAEAAPPAFQWRKSWWKVLSVFGAVTIAVAFLSPGGWVFKTIYLSGIWAMVFGLAAWSAHSQKTIGKRLGTTLGAASPDVYFGAEGLFADGVFLPWLTSGVYLLAAFRGQGEPSHLDFQFLKIGAGSSSQVVTQSVMLPEGAEADVARLRKELAAKCPSASISLD